MVWEEWSEARAAAAIAAIDLRIAWQVRAEPPFERKGYVLTGKGGSGDFVAVRTLAGSGEFWLVPDERCVTSAGQVLVFERKYLRYYTCASDLWHYWWFRFGALGSLAVPLNTPMNAGLIPHEQSTMQQIFDVLKQPVAERRRHASALLSGLLYGWVSEWKAQSRSSPAEQTVWAVIELMHEHLRTGWSVREMSELACVSERRLNQLFHSVVGMGPKKYFDDLRLERAVSLLQQRSASVSHIAAELGFRDPFYFSRWIATRLGYPPSEVSRHQEALGGLRS
ncbi:MAG TPA: AraC family transcriptional regulator [Fimbriimonadaceae bacterium]|nr:AraC family transcriptional regulator [Fimbriimonadaceae bacterium]